MKRLIALFAASVFGLFTISFLMAPTTGGSYFYTIGLNGFNVPRIATANITGAPSTCTVNRQNNMASTCTYNSAGNYTIQYSSAYTNVPICIAGNNAVSLISYVQGAGSLTQIVLLVTNTAGTATDGTVAVACYGYP